MALNEFAGHLRPIMLLNLSDNMMTVSYLFKQEATHSALLCGLVWQMLSLLCGLVWQIFKLALNSALKILVHHILGK